MRHTYYNRLYVTTGEVQQLPFADVDGARFGASFERGEDVVYDHAIALEIVNRWNEISANTGRKGDYIYWL